MRRSIIFACIAGCIAGALVYVFKVSVASQYDKLRGSMFSGFFTLGGFLLSLKTFTVVKMKEGLYDKPEYKTRHAQSVTAGSRDGLYAPLLRLKTLLFLSIIASLLTSVVQITVGLSAAPLAIAICFASAAFTVTLLIISLFQMNANLNDWLQPA